MDGGSKGCLLSFSGKSSSTPWAASRLDVRPPQEVANLVFYDALNRAAAIQSAEFIVGAGIVPTV
jgi:hypothetical protein